ncbi:bifunctional SulP family inorganic anion transporter/carbonic anhydrase [Methylogaea oryzae]|uniref:bifunctional SulP family inorganic anion transporter/carbonic anhydrase n=1 Tax=Methylogaea oryzae TaxID=1295382 RepID=UPI0006CF6405|nr:carbonic anhydrase family protein [Methylogaea oryzae]
MWESLGRGRKHAVPGGLLAIIAGIAVNESLTALGSPLALESTHLVSVPVAASPAEWLKFLDFPDFSRWSDGKVWSAALVLASMASVETLLNLEALEKLDPQRRYVSPNRELLAQGVGNVLSGLCGGLPLTSVVVRSSANLEAGAASRWSAIVQGLLLLVCVLTVPAWLNRVPLAAVAAVMLVIGYRMAHWELFRAMYAKGRDQFAPFLTTVVAVLLVDVLHGVAIGMAVSIVFILRRNFRNPIAFFRNRHVENHAIKLELASEVSFLNKASVLVSLENVPSGAKLIIDAGNTRYIDHDVLEILREFVEVKAPAKNIQLTLLGFQDRYDIDNTETIYDVVLGDELENLAEQEDLVYWQKTLQSRLTPHLALQLLKEGNFRFVNNLQMDRDLLKTINVTKEGQYPIAAILSCIDSRTSAELIFDQGLGDIFSIRIAGNVLNEDILGSMEFACKVAGSKIVVVLGHSRCGAIKGACDHVQLGHLTGLVQKVEPAMARVTHILEQRNSKNAAFVECVAVENVRWVMEQIYRRSPILAGMVDRNEIGIVGGMYEVESGVVEFYEDPRFLVQTDKDREVVAAMAMD